MLKYCFQGLRLLHSYIFLFVLLIFSLQFVSNYQSFLDYKYGPIFVAVKMASSESSSLNIHNNSTKFPCGTCDNTVTWEDRGVACESCGLWYHASCQSIRTQTYLDLDDTRVLWNCRICGNPNYSTHPFDLHEMETTRDPHYSSIQDAAVSSDDSIESASPTKDNL